MNVERWLKLVGLDLMIITSLAGLKRSETANSISPNGTPHPLRNAAKETEKIKF